MNKTERDNLEKPVLSRRGIIAAGVLAFAGFAAINQKTAAQTIGDSAGNYTPRERANLAAMKSYFDGLKAKDISRVKFAPDVVFSTVLIPRPATGEKAVRELTAGFAKRLLDVRVDRYLIDDDFGCARFEIDWDKSVIAHSVDYFAFSNSLIKSIEVYWDPPTIFDGKRNCKRRERK